jgi:hypothetical protein
MGLIHQATILHRSPIADDADKKKTGLLEHLLKPAGYDVVRALFFSFLQTAGAERAGILHANETGQYVLLFSRGLDTTTVRRFCPEASSVKPYCHDTESWFSFRRPDELASFKPYFSSTEYRSLAAIHIRAITMGDKPVFLVLVESSLNARRSPPDFAACEGLLANLSRTIESEKSVLDVLARRSAIRQPARSVRDHAQAAIDAGKKGTLLSISFGELFADPCLVHTDSGLYEVYATIRDRIVRQAGSLNIVSVMDNNDIHIVLFSGAPVDAEMYFRQLMKPLDKLFGIERIRKVKFQVEGTSSILHEILSFLNGEV